MLFRFCWNLGVALVAIQAVAGPEMGVVPGGSFRMGDVQGGGFPDEQPAHEVLVSTFRIDRVEVSNAEMCRVLQWALEQGRISADAGSVSNTTGQSQELLDLDDWNSEIVFADGRFEPAPDRGNYPCIEVTWFGAVVYANCRSELEGLEPCVDLQNWQCDFARNGYRLPTEAEWEKAARGGLIGQHFPWASYGTNPAVFLDGGRANYWESGDTNETQYAQRTTPVGYYDGHQLPVGPDMANGYGLYDMAGNVYEWCWDFYDPDWYKNPGATVADTAGSPLGLARVVRGGSWLSGNKEAESRGALGTAAIGLRCANRALVEPTNGRWNRGFRCVRRP